MFQYPMDIIPHPRWTFPFCCWPIISNLQFFRSWTQSWRLAWEAEHQSVKYMQHSLILGKNWNYKDFFFFSQKYDMYDKASGSPCPVGGQQLAVTDADTAPDELEFELVEGPVHGTLLRVDYGSQTPVVSGRSFLTPSMLLNALLFKVLKRLFL